MSKVLLYSGGMDSWLIDKLWKPDVRLFFRIGTANNEMEFQHIVETDYPVEVVSLNLSQFEQKENNFFLPLRNLHFAVYASHYGDTICLGATGSSTHKDKNETFATLSENVINYLLSEDSTRQTPVKIVMPYRTHSKTQLLAEYLKQGGDINKCYHDTFSCYSPDSNGNPCMMCTSCLSKFTAFYNNGMQFDKKTIDKFIQAALSNLNSKGDTLKLALKLKYGNNTVCIDFDKTITDDTPFPNTGKVRPGCKEALDKMVADGKRLVLYTSRVGADLDEAITICTQHGLPFSDYIGGKPYAIEYIDDKNIEFKGWQ